MDRRLLREYLAELFGTFAFVFLAAGITMLNHVAQPSDAGPLTVQQPGLLGLALAQGLAYAVLLTWTVPISGGYLNPAIALARWLSGGLSTTRFAWFVGAQIVGAVVAAFVLRLVFDGGVLTATHLGRPGPNPLVYSDPTATPALMTAFAIELVLTFFLGVAIFGNRLSPASFSGAMAGAMLTVCVLFGAPLAGAGLNPVRWLGPTFWEIVDKRTGPAEGLSALAYVGGPILGALAAVVFCRLAAPPGEVS
ncbi:MAG TPA: aquaporin [Gemmataceae bacterium]|jgi:aquaporin Z|nr:aquaporin [Gemmataceae bacterium]